MIPFIACRKILIRTLARSCVRYYEAGAGLTLSLALEQSLVPRHAVLTTEMYTRVKNVTIKIFWCDDASQSIHVDEK